jgi:hypothetical protein
MEIVTKPGHFRLCDSMIITEKTNFKDVYPQGDQVWRLESIYGIK